MFHIFKGPEDLNISYIENILSSIKELNNKLEYLHIAQYEVEKIIISLNSGVYIQKSNKLILATRNDFISKIISVYFNQKGQADISKKRDIEKTLVFFNHEIQSNLLPNIKNLISHLHEIQKYFNSGVMPCNHQMLIILCSILIGSPLAITY